MIAKFASLIVGAAILVSSCSDIPDKPVSERLSPKELSAAVEADTTFSVFYEDLKQDVDKMDDIKLAKFNDVTYRRLFKYLKFIRDTAYWNPLVKKWEREWEKSYGGYLVKAESKLAYWKKFLEENALDNYVKVELARIDKDYYEYIGELREVNLGFKMTPLRGPVEQICFNYGFQPKIEGDHGYYQTHRCITTSPFSSPTIRYWEVGYSDRDHFAGENVQTFLRDYDLIIEVTSIRMNGVNMSVDDLAVPDEVTECIEAEKDYPSLLELNMDNLVKALVHGSYVGKWEYITKKADKIREEEDKLCFDFLKELQ